MPHHGLGWRSSFILDVKLHHLFMLYSYTVQVGKVLLGLLIHLSSLSASAGLVTFIFFVYTACHWWLSSGDTNGFVEFPWFCFCTIYVTSASASTSGLVLNFPMINAFFALELIGGVGCLAVLLTGYFSHNIPRYSTWYSLLVSWILSSVYYSLL